MIAGSRSILVSITAAGTDGGMVVFARDVTEDRRYDALRREFVANVSHELRTPLSLAQGYVETLIDGACRDPEKAPEFLGMVDRNLKRLGAIVADLLQLSRLEDTAAAPRVDRFDGREFVSRIHSQFMALADRKRQKLELAVDESLGTLDADPELLERAVANLVDNAIKYTQESGTITIRGATRDGECVFSVRDDGPGIPEAAQPRIFERFYRVDKSRSRELGGTGLGLAIVKHIAQLHGGSITVDSSPGQGSVFTLRLPLKNS
jgi:two-component system phosphate regulon sensor histidine kinase PhoR